ncbi:MAG: RtcB family protein, partial [Defluviitaleaceae bacterium]|nr:RtcB family protein [Defluviitaleaceae bacterium]
MIEIKGKHNTAICYCDEVEKTAVDQIRTLCDLEEFAECKIRIMPDVHAGMGSTIGTTMTIKDKIVPNMVGVDIGCGMETVEIAEKGVDFEQLDRAIRRNIPSGRDVRKSHHVLNEEIGLDKLRCKAASDLKRARLSIGTLGGGNHFIEVGRADDGRLFVVVHSGSRHLGNQVAKYYQDRAIAELKGPGMKVPRDLAYVTGQLFDDYLHDMKLVQYFAVLNRKAMIDVILTEMGLTAVEAFTTIHNYV